MNNIYKKCLAFFCLLGFSIGITQAQLEDGSVAPDFTLTDINGTTWNLYTLLDEGKTVVLDFSAVWCGPCWSYHDSGALENLYDDYGPEGTNEVMVFYIEGDGASTMDELNGIGSGTQGNWVTGTNYPIILTSASSADYAVVGDYAIGYFPTIYAICPNRIVTESPQENTALLYERANNCEAASVSNDASLIDYTGTVSACNSEIDLTVRLQNMGLSPLSSCTSKAFDGTTEMASFNWTGGLTTYQIEEVVIGSILVDQLMDISFEVTSADDNASNNVLAEIAIGPVDATQIIHLTLKTDSYPEETTWELLDEDGDVVKEGGPYNGETNTIVFDEDIELEIGCFEFKIYDVFGDGICCSYGAGYYEIENSDLDLIIEGGAFKEQEIRNLKVATTNAINSELVHAFSVFPNPTYLATKVSFTLLSAAELTVEITNLLGNTVVSEANALYAAGNNTLNLDLQNVAAGMYLVTLKGERISQSMSLSVIK